MTDFEKNLKEDCENMQVPEAYSRRVQETLEQLPEKEKPRKKIYRTFAFRFACILVLAVCLVLYGSRSASANIFADFTKTLLNYFHIGENDEGDNSGVESGTEEAVSRPELNIRLKETVVDKNCIYALVDVTFPMEVDFTKNVGFEYFAFCRGESYNADDLIGGATDCALFEVRPNSNHEATYVVSITTTQNIEDGESVMVYFQDFSLNPFGEEPEKLVEGMWKLSFTAEYTVADEVLIEGDREMAVPYIDKTAYVQGIRMTPLGMTLDLDVTEVPEEVINVSDSRVRVSLLLIDGREILLMSHDFEEEVFVSASETVFDNKDGRLYASMHYEFAETIDLNKVAGVYLEDVFIPARATE